MIGETINNYEVDEIIEEGGMSIVYLGIHKLLKRKAAIKMLDPILAKKKRYVERFRNEAKLLSKLNHPNIIAVYDYVENKKGIFLITEFIQGQTLDEYIDLVTGPMPETKANKLMLKILDAVSYVHEKNIIHRDIKPSNFIITDKNEVKLIDFGIAKSLEKMSPLVTSDNSKVGTTLYMSPQQVKGKILDRRSDIYSLGAMLFQMVTGQHPYDKDLSQYEIYNKIVNEAFPNPKNFYVGVSDKMRDIIAKATEKRPLDRFQSCEEFNIALTQNQTRRKKNISPSLRTRIIEVNDEDIKKPIFSNKFWQDLVMLIATLFFLATIAVGIFLISPKDIRHVISGEEALFANSTENSEIIETLNFGETVNVISSETLSDSLGNHWIKVSSLRDNLGYVLEENIQNSHVYSQINSIFANTYSRFLTPAKFKLAMRQYYIENRMFKQNYTDWKFIAESKKKFEYNLLATGDFNNNSIPDFACIITNQITKKQRLLIFFDDLKQSISVDFSENIKIKTLQKNAKGGKWFIGNFIEKRKDAEHSYKTKKYEHLKSDAILLLKSNSLENIIYIYDNDEKTLKFFSQKND